MVVMKDEILQRNYKEMGSLVPRPCAHPMKSSRKNEKAWYARTHEQRHIVERGRSTAHCSATTPGAHAQSDAETGKYHRVR